MRSYGARAQAVLLVRIALLCILIIASTPALATVDQTETSAFDQRTALAISQAAIGTMLGDYRFIDSRGRVFNLSTLHGRPLLISLIYTSCYHTCPVLSKQLAQLVRIARDALGENSFAVLTVGFDSPADTPQRLASYARALSIDEPDWYFLSADKPTIEELASDLGFVYFASPRGFDHTAQITLIDQQGVVYRQIYSDFLQAPDLVEPLKQLVFGRRAEAAGLDGWINGLRLLCTVYDPNSGRYTFDYSIFVGAAVGLLCLGAVAVFIVRAWRET